MTGVDCEALRGLLAKATQGKWFVYRATKYHHVKAVGDKFGDHYIMEGGFRGLARTEHDARLIAAMHEALPALLAKSAEYDALVAGTRKLVESWENCYEMCGSIAYRNCADELECLLVSDDRPSHTAGENDARR